MWDMPQHLDSSGNSKYDGANEAHTAVDNLKDRHIYIYSLTLLIDKVHKKLCKPNVGTSDSQHFLHQDRFPHYI